LLRNSRNIYSSTTDLPTISFAGRVYISVPTVRLTVAAVVVVVAAEHQSRLYS
jgi:hypothetical protein